MLLAERVNEIAESRGGELAVPVVAGAGALNELSPEAILEHVKGVFDSPALGANIGSIGTVPNPGNAIKFADESGALARDHYYDEGKLQFVNSIGLRECGIEAAKPIIREAAMMADDKDKMLKVSVTSLNEEDASIVAPQLVYEAFEAGAPHVEVNLGCPNKVESSGQRHAIIGLDPEATMTVLQAVADEVGQEQSWGAKLSWYDPEIRDGVRDYFLLKEVLDAVICIKGLDFVTIANTKPGVSLNLPDGTPALDKIPGNIGGGSGPAWADFARDQLKETRRKLPTRIDVVSANGVWNGNEILRRERAGAVFSETVGRLWHEQDKHQATYSQTLKRMYEDYLWAREDELR